MAGKSTLLLDTANIDRNLKAPVHRQLYDFLRTHIVKGRLSAGLRLPSTRALANALGVGRNSVIAAYEQLLTEGYLEARSGLAHGLPKSCSTHPRCQPLAWISRLHEFRAVDTLSQANHDSDDCHTRSTFIRVS